MFLQDNILLSWNVGGILPKSSKLILLRKAKNKKMPLNHQDTKTHKEQEVNILCLVSSD